MDNQLTILLAEKLNLACDYVEANGADILNRYIQNETRICQFKMISLICVLVIGLIMLIYLINGYVKGSEKVCDVYKLTYKTEKLMNNKGFVLMIVGSVMTAVGVVSLPFIVCELIRWINCPEIQVLEALGL